MEKSSIDGDGDPRSGHPHPERIVVGLGNPGERYENTRHNVGFRVMEELARRQEARLVDAACHSRLCRTKLGGAEEEAIEWILAAPQTYMNRSGHAVRCLAERFDLGPQNFLIVYDEIHLPLGKLRLRPGGNPAGHRGMESVLENLGSGQVARLRLGVAPEDGPLAGEDWAEFVLAPFAAGEKEVVAAMIERAADACEKLLK